MCPKEHRGRHPVEERRAQQRRCVFGKQDDLENRRLQTGLDAIIDVARQVAQEIGVKNVLFTGTGIQPDGEDKVFGACFVSPETMPVSPKRGSSDQSWWVVSRGRAITHRVPRGMWKTPSSLVMAYSTPSLTAPNTPCSTLKNSSCKRWICLPSQTLRLVPFAKMGSPGLYLQWGSR